jgi:hypothetical protein
VVRDASRRFSALIAAFLFLLSSAGEGFGIQPCPFHDATYGASADEHASAGHDSGSDHAADAHGGHGAHAHGAPQSDHDGARGHGHHDDSGLCTHVEVCQSSAGIHLPTGLDIIEFAAVVDETPSILPPVERHFAAFIPFFFPYPNAPPALG